MEKIVRLIREEEGIQHAEEALLLALIAVALTAAATTLKGGIANVFTTANGKMAVS
ncbi:MAG: Flp family type IVb pilin [Chloroflexi bacterium]|nr:Flp family type IVb pilin [Chloroflexota bacterium]